MGYTASSTSSRTLVLEAKQRAWPRILARVLLIDARDTRMGVRRITGVSPGHKGSRETFVVN